MATAVSRDPFFIMFMFESGLLEHFILRRVCKCHGLSHASRSSSHKHCDIEIAPEQQERKLGGGIINATTQEL